MLDISATKQSDAVVALKVRGSILDHQDRALLDLVDKFVASELRQDDAEQLAEKLEGADSGKTKAFKTARSRADRLNAKSRTLEAEILKTRARTFWGLVGKAVALNVNLVGDGESAEEGVDAQYAASFVRDIVSIADSKTLEEMTSFGLQEETSEVAAMLHLPEPEPVHQRNERDQKLASAFFDLEDDICSVRLAAKVASGWIIDDNLGEREEAKFLIHQLVAMTDTLHAKWERSLKEARTSADEASSPPNDCRGARGP